MRRRGHPGYDPVIGGLTVGAHWDNIRGRWKGEDAELVLVEQPAAFLAELPSYGLHPSMLDSANALGQSIAADARFLPFGYDRIVVRGRFPERVFSHIRHRDDTTGDMTRSDITIMDAEGRELVAIEGFTLLAYDSGGQAEATAALPGAGAVVGRPLGGGRPGAAAAARGRPRVRHPAGGRLGRPLADPRQRRAPAAHHVPRRAGRAAAPGRRGHPGGAARADRPGSAAGRRGHRAQPRHAVRGTGECGAARPVRVLAGLLGVDKVGVDDDFFDLGGNSLIAVQLVARIREHFRTELAVAVLFECRTVRNLAADIEATLVERVAGMTDEEAAELLATLE
nr:hypothetical protein GCM10020093_034420 [Planobispora longispora]